MIDHVTVSVSDYGRSKAFYEAALAPLDYRVQMEFQGQVGGFAGPDRKPALWIKQGARTARVHVALRGADRATVVPSTPPRSPPVGRTTARRASERITTSTTTGAFVHDPDGNNVEAVRHQPE